MMDLGDEIGTMLLRGPNREFLYALQQFYRIYQSNQSKTDDRESRDIDTRDENLPASEVQLDYLKRMMGAEDYSRLNLQNLNRLQASSLIRDLAPKENHMFFFGERAVSEFSRLLKQNGHFCSTPEVLPGAIIIDDKGFEDIGRSIEAFEKETNIKFNELDPDKPNLGLSQEQLNAIDRSRNNRQPDEPQVADGSLDMDGRTSDINQGIESHDGMDIDARTLVTESTGFQWKEDLAARAAEARELANSHEELVARCAERGITLDRATDGQYLYRDSNNPWRNVRGDTLGERFKYESFGTPSLAERASAARDVVGSVNADLDAPMFDRSVPSR